MYVLRAKLGCGPWSTTRYFLLAQINLIKECLSISRVISGAPGLPKSETTPLGLCFGDF
jgi:hypothetical protein